MQLVNNFPLFTFQLLFSQIQNYVNLSNGKPKEFEESGLHRAEFLDEGMAVN